MMKKLNVILSSLVTCSSLTAVLADDEPYPDSWTGEYSQATRTEKCTPYFNKASEYDGGAKSVELSASSADADSRPALINGTKTNGYVSFEITLRRVCQKDDSPYISMHGIELRELATGEYFFVRFDNEKRVHQMAVGYSFDTCLLSVMGADVLFTEGSLPQKKE